MIRLVIHSSCVLRGELLAGMLSQCCSLAMVEVCDHLDATLASIDQLRPDLLLLDCDAWADGCERAVGHLLTLRPEARYLLLSSDPRHDPLRHQWPQALLHPPGADLTWQTLLDALNSLNDSMPDPTLAPPLPDAACFEALCPREQRVLDLLGTGLGSREIALRLGLSLQTVETYRKSLSAKLGVSGARLVRVAVLSRCVRFQRHSAVVGQAWRHRLG